MLHILYNCALQLQLLSGRADIMAVRRVITCFFPLTAALIFWLIARYWMRIAPLSHPPNKGILFLLKTLAIENIYMRRVAPKKLSGPWCAFSYVRNIGNKSGVWRRSVRVWFIMNAWTSKCTLGHRWPLAKSSRLPVCVRDLLRV